MKKTILASMLAVMMATPAFAAESTDIVIIGSGGAGLSSAITATEKGAKVIVLEKMAYFGGNSNRSEGEMNAAGTKQQKAHGITDDTPERFAADTIRGGHGLNDPALVKALTENAASAEEWLLDLGAHFCHRMGRGGGQTRARGHGPCDGSPVGIEIMRVLGERADKDHIDMRLNNRVTKILMKNGKVSGVQVKTPKGMETINAKAVIIATGGFGANEAMKKKYLRFPGVDGLAQTGKTGDGIQMAWKAGAAEDGVEVQASYRPGPKGVGTTNQVAASAKQPHLWLNPEGDRFVDETVMLEWPFAGNALERNGGKMWVVYDQATLDYMKNEGIDLGVGVMVPVATKLTKFDSEWDAAEKAGWAKKANTLDELAKMTGMHADVLKKNVAEYNHWADIRHDGLFAKNPKYIRHVNKAPYYAIQLVATSLGTLGGIKIDDKWEVVRKDDSPIKGLYAAGNDAGGMYGDSYDLLMAGSTIAWAVNGGRIAAENAVKYIGLKK